MSLKKILFFASAFIGMFSFFPLSASAQVPFDQSHFISVSGKVTVSHGKRSRKVHKNSTVNEGDTVATGKKSSAALRFFDGSEMKVMSNTRFTISKLAKTSEDKIFNFNLAVGKLKAFVKKLTTSHSAFEIDAGGIVCGVRGTEYEVDFDPHQDKVDIVVTEGSVWAKSGGETYQYGAGGQGHFIGRKPNPGGGQDQGSKGPGKKTQGSSTAQPPGPPDNFTPFYGMGGNRPDPFQPLTGGPPDINRITNKTGDDTLLGLGAHTLILQLKYPEQ